MCEQALCAALTAENACVTLVLADLYSAEQLRTHAINYINVNATEVSGGTAASNVSGAPPSADPSLLSGDELGGVEGPGEGAPDAAGRGVQGAGHPADAPGGAGGAAEEADQALSVLTDSQGSPRRPSSPSATLPVPNCMCVEQFAYVVQSPCPP